METNIKIFLILFCLITKNSYAAGEDYVSPSLYFNEALKEYNSKIDPDSIAFTEDLQGVAEQRVSNFKEKAKLQNTLNADYLLYLVNFEMNEHKVACLGSIFPISHAIMETEEGREFKDRSGMVYLTECLLTKGTTTEPFPPNFAIIHYMSFPKVENLPIANISNLEKYKLFKNVVVEDKLFQCVNADSNTFGTPRTSVSVYRMKDHYVFGIKIGSSSADPEDSDIPVNIGEIDLGSVDWLKDNINFFLRLGSKGATAFNIIFKQEDCQILGPEETVTAMTCRLDIPDPENRKMNIEKVMIHFVTQAVSSPIPSKDAKKRVGFKSFLVHKLNLEFTVDEPNKYYPIFEKTFYRNLLEYRRDEVRGEECKFRSELPKRPEGAKSSKGKPGVKSFDI